jgi:hypothetical protein
LLAIRDEITLRMTRGKVVRTAKKLGLRPDLGLDVMVARVEALRGQKVQLVCKPLPRATTGLCAFGEEADTIIVNSRAEPLHRVLITLHELWHLIEDLPAPSIGIRAWRQCVVRPLQRCRLWPSKTKRSAFGEHSVLELDNLVDVLDALPPELVKAVLADSQQVKLRGERSHRHDPAEVFARQMLQMVPLGDDPDGTGSLASSFDHRRTGI